MKNLLVLSLVLVALAPSAEAKKRNKGTGITPLKILESYTLPAVELSGMAWRKSPESGRQELILVGDGEHALTIVDWDKRANGQVPSRRVEPKALEGAPWTEQSEWESVFADDSGRVFILRENPSQIYVLSAALDRVEAIIELKVKPTPDANQKENLAWDAHDNSKGEGVLLLKNGHVLVVKEKNPLRVIEFAPSGSEASGYRPALSLEGGGKFPLPAGTRLVFEPVHVWRFASKLEDLVEDASGLNASAKGELYLLGDQRNVIAHLTNELDSDRNKMKVDHLYSIPSSIQQPEGMVFDSENRPILAIDRKNAKNPNLFLLSEVK